jgi:hypothetical protein
MPFTLSHPAAILPLRLLLGRFGVLSALVIGSMAPDFPYFVGKPWPRIFTHTLESVVWFSLPVGWCVYVLFEYILRRPIWIVAGLTIGLVFSPPSLASVRSIARFIAYIVISGLSTTLLLLGLLSLQLFLRQETVQKT